MEDNNNKTIWVADINKRTQKNILDEIDELTMQFIMRDRSVITCSTLKRKKNK
jgi:gluconate kinase